MRVRVVPFGVFKDWLGPNSTTIKLPDGASVAELLEHLRSELSARTPVLSFQGIAVSVNMEYAQASHILHDGDEVGLLPPVSGGNSHEGAAPPEHLLDENEGEP